MRSRFSVGTPGPLSCTTMRTERPSALGSVATLTTPMSGGAASMAFDKRFMRQRSSERGSKYMKPIVGSTISVILHAALAGLLAGERDGRQHDVVDVGVLPLGLARLAVVHHVLHEPCDRVLAVLHDLPCLAQVLVGVGLELLVEHVHAAAQGGQHVADVVPEAGDHLTDGCHAGLLQVAAEQADVLDGGAGEHCRRSSARAGRPCRTRRSRERCRRRSRRACGVCPGSARTWPSGRCST